jgi:hypothetical protein
VALVRKQSIPTEQPPLPAKLVTTFADRRVSRGQHGGSLRPYSRFSWPDRTILHFFILPSCYDHGPWLGLCSTGSNEILEMVTAYFPVRPGIAVSGLRKTIGELWQKTGLHAEIWIRRLPDKTQQEPDDVSRCVRKTVGKVGCEPITSTKTIKTTFVYKECTNTNSSFSAPHTIRAAPVSLLAL